MISRLKNLWELSKLKTHVDAERQSVTLWPQGERKSRRLASIVDLDEVDMFPKEPEKPL